jgi:hypothetical protein
VKPIPLHPEHKQIARRAALMVIVLVICAFAAGLMLGLLHRV